MKLRKELSILLSAMVLLQLLTGCHSRPTAEVSPGPDVSAQPTQGRKEGPSDAPVSSENPTPEPTPEPDLWDPEHTLDFRFTPAKGLELPISGATGYASIKLPLWEELPEGDEGKLATVYAPPEPEPEPEEPSAQPTLEPNPEATESAPGPDPKATESAPEPDPEATESTPEPDPEAAESAPEGTVPPAEENPEGGAAAQADEPAAGGDEGGADPTPTVGSEGPFIDPTEAPTGEPSAEPTAEPEPEPTPEETAPAPVPESTEPEPEPTPTPDPLEEALLVLEPGTPFLILSESGDWWQVRAEGETGWIEHRYCLINLPDVVPSIIYNATNAYSSVFVSSGKDIPNITGKALYHGKEDNARLGRKEFMMPVLYAMAKNVGRAQQNALAEGNTLVLYEGYRPYETQMAVARSLSALSKRDAEVKEGISTRPWNISWFIATGSSNHQEGYAMDVSLAKVTKAHLGSIGGYSLVQVDEYEEYDMPTAIHELSMAAATYTQPVAIFSTTAWRSATMTPAMAASEPAKALQRYCTSAGLTPLASEWWHFNDLAAYGQIRDYPSTGGYVITQCLSTAP